MLATLLLHPERQVTQAEPARDLNIPLTTAADEVGRLLSAGIISSMRVGRSVVLSANEDSRIVPVLTQLLAMTYGPAEAVTMEFEGIGDAVLLFGSWAARWHGASGAEPGDVDVLVLGDADRSDAYAAATRTEERVGFPVNPVIRPIEAWKAGGDPLLDDIKSKPYVVARGTVDDSGVTHG